MRILRLSSLGAFNVESRGRDMDRMTDDHTTMITSVNGGSQAVF